MKIKIKIWIKDTKFSISQPLKCCLYTSLSKHSVQISCGQNNKAVTGGWMFFTKIEETAWYRLKTEYNDTNVCLFVSRSDK